MKTRSHCMRWTKPEPEHNSTYFVSLGQTCWNKIDRTKMGFCFLLHICLSANESWAGWKLKDVVAGAAFETPFSHAQDRQRQLIIVLNHEHAHGCPAPLFPPGTEAIAPGQLRAWRRTCRSFCCQSTIFLLNIVRIFGGMQGARGNIPWSVGCQLDHCEERLILPHEHRQKESVLLWKTAEW